MATNAGQFFIIGFDRMDSFPHFVEQRFDSYAKAEQYMDDNIDFLTGEYWNIQIYQMDRSRNFIEQF